MRFNKKLRYLNRSLRASLGMNPIHGTYVSTPVLVIRSLLIHCRNLSKRLTYKTKLNLCLLALVLIYALQAGATIKTWSNDAGTCNWNTAGNWSPSGVPGSSDTVLFNNTSLANCSTTASASVRMLEIQSGYTGIITQSVSFNFIVGASGFTQNGGTFMGSEGAFTCNGTFALSGGTFQFGSGGYTSAGTVTISGGIFTGTTGTIDINAAFILSGGSFTCSQGNTQFVTHITVSGGSFSHNNGTVVIDGSNSRTINASSSLSLAYLNLNTGSDSIIIATGDTLYCSKTATLTNGRLYTGVLTLDDSLIIGSSWDGGSAPVLFRGGNTQRIITNGSIGGLNLYINKNSSSQAVQVYKGSANPSLGFSTATLTIQQGTLSFPNNDTTTFTYNQIIVNENGVLSLSGSWTNLGSNLTTNGGRIVHNSGTVQMNATASRTYTSQRPDTLYNFVINVASSYTFSIQTNDTLVIAGTLTLTDGNMGTGTLLAMGHINMQAGWDGGDAPIIFSGSSNNSFVVDDNNTTSNFIINKTNATDTVYFSASGTLMFGGSATSFTVQKGVAVFQNGVTSDLNFGTLTIASTGTLVASSGTTTFSGNFTNNGSFVGNGGTFSFDASTTQTIDVNTSSTFANLTINKGSGSILTLGTGDSLVTTGTLNLSNGTVNDGFFSAQGNVTVGSSFDGGTTKLVFTGSSNQNFDLTSATALFNGDIILNKSNPSAQVTLQSGLNLDHTAGSQKLVLTSGVLVTGSNTLIIADNIAVDGGSGNSYVQGLFRKIGNDAFTFPVGNGGFYAPIGISAPSNPTHHFTASYYNSNPNGSYDRSSKDVSLHHISLNEYWILDQTNGSSQVTVTLSWDNLRSGGVNNLSHLRVCRWNGSSWANHGQANLTGNTLAGTVTTSAVVTSFSPFTFGSTDPQSTLPVEFVHFTGHRTGEQLPVELRWTTASETNNSHFTIERLEDGKTFTPVGRVEGQGTTSTSQTYQYIDWSAPSHALYYRLLQTDFDGSTHYSVIIGIDPVSELIKTLYPNPVSAGGNHIQITLKQDIPAEIILYSVNGQEQTVRTQQTGTNVSVWLDHVLPGIYQVCIKQATDETYTRIVVH